jgi:hypothetical protein
VFLIQSFFQSGSEPGLRGELRATSAEGFLVGKNSQAAWSTATKTKGKGQLISADLWKLLFTV